ncbi:MAG: nucleotide exchange factor GrpE [Solirubrobacterales bacterium]
MSGEDMNRTQTAEAECAVDAAAETVAEEKDEMTVLQEQLAEEKARADENYDKYVRALAEADNQRKRWQREKEELVRYANLGLIKKMLPVSDDFKRARAAAATAQDVASLLKGFDLIEKKLGDLIEQEGVTPIAAQGEMFDPQRHEALMTEETDEHPDGTIMEELQTGYEYKDRILRPSLVKVAKNV